METMSKLDLLSQTIDSHFNLLNNNKYFAGFMMLLLNLGSKYISFELSESHEKLMNNPLARRVLVFTVVFIATRDIKVSLIITLIFIILVSGLFHEDSSYCILPKYYKDHELTRLQYLEARQVVSKYEKLHPENKETNVPTNMPTKVPQ